MKNRKGNAILGIGVVIAIVLIVFVIGNSITLAQYNAEVRDAIEQMSQETPEPIGIGVYTWDTPYEEMIGADDFQSRIGQQLDYVLWFQAIGDHDANFQRYHVEQSVLRDWMPIITLEPWIRNLDERTNPQPEYSFARVAAGNFDGYFRNWARQARDLGAPMYVRFGQDPSVTGTWHWYPWQDDLPDNYVNAWRRMVDIFREEGATNVQFMWSSHDLAVASQWDFYPGDEYVSAIATTTLNFGAWGTWQSFGALFEPQYAEILERAPGKPIFIVQLASAEEGGDKAAWITESFAALQEGHEAVHGVIFWEVPSDWQFAELNWAINSSDAAQMAAQTAVAPHVSTPAPEVTAESGG